MVHRRGYDDAPGKLEGSLTDVAVRKLLETCRTHRLTGTLRIVSWGRAGSILLLAGQVEQAFFGMLRGDRALAELLSLRDGLFELYQELPDPARAASPYRGRSSLSALLHQCRERTLSCIITMTRHRDHAEVCCYAGQIVSTRINGIRHPGAARDLRYFEHGRARVAPLPLSLDGHIPPGHPSFLLHTGLRAAGERPPSSHH